MSRIDTRRRLAENNDIPPYREAIPYYIYMEETEEKNGHQNDKELEIQEKEEAYYQYLEQRAVAKKRGLDPESVEIPEEAKEFLKENHVGKSRRAKKKRRNKREVDIENTVTVNVTNNGIDSDFNNTISEGQGSFNVTKNGDSDNRTSKRRDKYIAKSRKKIRRDNSDAGNS
ncbi:hypothetical protein KUTeg_016423 [Tegillarca granosa]|uniref:Uncharacterized protein n=1 Tax=Tegillarca granosa TaxID=220873 RepID=A0ABQ9ERH4_TEGGR|nr:hypothetical protein KUTeg_016423 [Tegillarca granosa]